MVDMELDNLFDEPSKPGPSRPSRFAPKGSRLRPNPNRESVSTGDVKIETKPEPDEMVVEFLHNGGVKKEETDDFMETELPVVATEVEDEVVREIDVYFNPSVDSNTKLYVLQYPLRPLWRPYELDDRCEAVRVKSEGGELEIDLAIDVDSRNYNSSDETKQMGKQTLSTRWKPSHTSGYTAAVGVLVENKLHLNPVHAVVQLRPSMQHLFSEESKKKAIPPVGVVKKVAFEKKVKAEKPLEGPSDQMDWVPLRYLGMKSDLASRYMHKMAEAGGSSIHFSMSSYDYLAKLCPGTSNQSVKSGGPPRRVLLGLPLEERLKTWLREGPPLQRFDALKYLAKEEPDEQILGILQEHAVIVQGLWVLKTTLFYGTDKGLEVHARDYILSLFSKNVLINNSQIPNNQKVAKSMRDVLKVFAVERPTFKDWKLKELPDESFIKRYPSLVNKQFETWQNVEEKAGDHVGAKRRGPSANAPSSSSSTVIDLSTSKASAKVSIKDPKVETSKNGMTEEAQDATTKAILKLLKMSRFAGPAPEVNWGLWSTGLKQRYEARKPCALYYKHNMLLLYKCYQQIGQRIRDMAVSENTRPTAFAKVAVVAANSISDYPDELPAIIDQVAFNIHGVCVPKSSPDHPQYDQFRSVVIKLLQAEGPSAKLKRATITEAAKLKLAREIPQAEFQKVLHELCISKGSVWVLQSGDGNPNH